MLVTVVQYIGQAVVVVVVVVVVVKIQWMLVHARTSVDLSRRNE